MIHTTMRVRRTIATAATFAYFNSTLQPIRCAMRSADVSSLGRPPASRRCSPSAPSLR